MPKDALYVWGWLDFRGPVSRAEQPDQPALEWPVRIPDLPTACIDSISVGDRHCVFISNGKIFGFGRNTARQLHHQAQDVCDTVMEIKLPGSATGTPVQVACGSNHTLVLLSDGSVMSCGDNSACQLGHVKDTVTPAGDNWRAWARVALSVSASSVAASGDSSFVLSGEAVYSWGLQKHGHLGHGTTGELEREASGPAKFEPVEFPTKVQWFANHKIRIRSLSVSPSHALFHTVDGEIYGVGDNSYGKLGFAGSATALIPQRVRVVAQSDIPETLLSVTCGTDTSFAIFHVEGLGRIVYCWGKLPNDSSPTPLRIMYGVPPEIQAIKSGWGLHIAIADGAVHSWGKPNQTFHCTNAMQYGLTDDKRSTIYPGIVQCMQGKYVREVAIGKTFAVLVADDERFAPPPTAIPENQTRHCMVPQGNRYARGYTARYTPTHFEEAVKSYLIRTCGAQRAAQVFSELPAASAEAKLVKKLDKRGAHGLGIGSKVRVWMTDVYALGIITGRDMDGFQSTQFEVKWVREDWESEVIELASDDETLDEANDNRWQNIWFES